jgi:hypothetical protein
MQPRVVTKCAPRKAPMEAHFVGMQFATKWTDLAAHFVANLRQNVLMQHNVPLQGVPQLFLVCKAT